MDTWKQLPKSKQLKLLTKSNEYIKKETYVWNSQLKVIDKLQ